MRANQIVTILLLALCSVAAVASEPAPQAASGEVPKPASGATPTGIASPAPQAVSEEALEQQLMTGQAWAKFCDRMKALGQ